MRKNVNRLAAVALGVACSSLGFGLVGCEKVETEQRQADRRVQENIKAGLTQQDSARSLARLKEDHPDVQRLSDEAAKLLRQATDDTQASQVVQARAKAVLAYSNDLKAQAAFRQLESLQIIALGTLWEMDRVVAQIDANNKANAMAAARNPAGGPLKAVEDAKAKNGKELDDANAELKATNEKIAAIQQQIATWQQEKSAAEVKSADLAKSSNAARGEEAMKIYKEALDQRELASTRAQQIQEADQALRAQQRQAAELKTRVGGLQEAVAHMDKQAAELNTAWEKVKQESDARSAESRKLAEAGAVGAAGEGEATTRPAGPRSLAMLNAQLAQQMKLVEAKRVEALDAFEKAGAAYDQATKLSHDAAGALQRLQTEAAFTGDNAALLRKLMELYRSPRYQLRSAETLASRAKVKSDEVTLLATKADVIGRLQPALETAKLTMPEGLVDAQIRASVEAAKNEAIKLYARADETFKELATDTEYGAPARVQQMFAAYGQYHLTQKQDELSKAHGLYKALASEKLISAKVPLDLETGQPLQVAEAIPKARANPGTPSAGGGGAATQPAGGTPPTDGGVTTQPADGGAVTPPTDGGAVTPPTDGGAVTPPTDGGAVTPPVDGGATTEPADAGAGTPPPVDAGAGAGTPPPADGAGGAGGQ